MSRAESPAEIADRLRAEREGAPGAPAEMVLAITGSRKREPGEVEMVAFGRLWRELRPVRLIHGACRGTDEFIAARAKARGIDVKDYPVRHEVDGPWPAAGPRRNGRMLVTGRAGALAAFPGEKGTRSCIGIALDMGLPVYGYKSPADGFVQLQLLMQWDAWLIAEKDRVLMAAREALERELIDVGLWG